MMNKILIVLLFVALSVSTFGCQRQKESDEDLLPDNADESPIMEAKEMTNPTRLHEFWEEYIYHAVHTVMNTDEYDSAAEINPNDIIDYCWNQYVDDNGYEYLDQLLEYQNRESSFRLFPLEIAQEYMQSYFNIDGVDLSMIHENDFDSERNAFIVRLSDQPKDNKFYYLNSGAGFLEKATKNNDGTITCILNRYIDLKKEYVERITVCTLKERVDGSFYFLSGSNEYLEDNRLEIVGNYEKFESSDLVDLIDDTSSSVIVGEINNNIIIKTVKHGIPLISVDTDTMKVKKELMLQTNRETFQAKIRDDKIYAMLEDRTIIYDSDFEKLKEIVIPQTMYDDNGNPPRGYDISTDYSKIVYTDEGSIKLYDLDTDEEALLVEALLVEDPKWGLVRQGYAFPRFVNADMKIIATRVGYEWSEGYYCYNFADKALTRFDSFEGLYRQNIFYDSGMLTKIRTSEHYEDRGTSEFIISYLDFDKSEIFDIEKEIIGGPVRYVITHGQFYCGNNHIAFLTQEDSQALSPEDNTWYIHRLELPSLEVQTNLLTVKGARVRLLGVLENGKVIFIYNRWGTKSWIGVI